MRELLEEVRPAMALREWAGFTQACSLQPTRTLGCAPGKAEISTKKGRHSSGRARRGKTRE